MFAYRLVWLPAILILSALEPWSVAKVPASETQPPRKFSTRAELQREYDRDGDGRLSAEERRKMVEDIAAGRVEVPEQFREAILRIEQRLRDRTNPPAGRGASDKVVVHRDVVYGEGGGRPLKLDIILPQPEPEGPLPLIVFVHGGGWRGGDKAGGVGRVAPLVATGNYVGATIGYRLSGEATWPAQIHDCKAAIRWLRANAQKYHVDPERIGVWGSSAGGHLVNMLGTSGGVEQLEGSGGSPDQSSRVQCVVPFCGPTNFLAPRRLEGGRPEGAVHHLLGGAIEDRQEMAREASPITYVSAGDPPFLIVHGTADQTVPFEQAEMFYEALKKAGVEVTFVRIVGGSHAVGGEEVMQRVAAFFDKHLRGQDVEVSEEPIQAPAAR
ncbi:MAG: alpha/beta hydrolase [Thermoguttaceae bacterium]|jgi:acetyl esterase/lipase|nr:alpha/beta hydrolase [Thermoguttaceae bacterium]